MYLSTPPLVESLQKCLVPTPVPLNWRGEGRGLCSALWFLWKISMTPASWTSLPQLTFHSGPNKAPFFFPLRFSSFDLVSAAENHKYRGCIDLLGTDRPNASFAWRRQYHWCAAMESRLNPSGSAHACFALIPSRQRKRPIPRIQTSGEGEEENVAATATGPFSPFHFVVGLPPVVGEQFSHHLLFRERLGEGLMERKSSMEGRGACVVSSSPTAKKEEKRKNAKHSMAANERRAHFRSTLNVTYTHTPGLWRLSRRRRCRRYPTFFYYMLPLGA